MSEPSEIMNGRMVAALVFAMPSPLLKERAWNCVYSLVRDGACCATLMKSCRHHATYLLVVEDSWGYVFGASWSHGLSDAHGGTYYGTGETWLFSFHNLAPEQLVTYPWTMANELMVLSDPHAGIAFGGGGGFGLQLDDEGPLLFLLF